MTHNYLKKLLRGGAYVPLYESGRPKVGVHFVTVAHDKWCGVFLGRECNCDPNISIEPRAGAPK